MKTKNKLNYTLGCIISVGFCTLKVLDVNGQTPIDKNTEAKGIAKTDINIITIPFKIRPAEKNIPAQLNSNFSTALYIGKRKDHQKTAYGYGAFAGIGSATMNPLVTEQKIDYEYDGMVTTAGLAAIYNSRKLNVGLAIGADLLLDKNRAHWAYQGKPWIGLLIGIDLN